MGEISPTEVWVDPTGPGCSPKRAPAVAVSGEWPLSSPGSVGAGWNSLVMEARTPRIDVILRSFLEDESVGRSHFVGARYYRVMAHLCRYLESVDAGAVLGPESETLLAAEREMNPRGAFLRLFTAHDLVHCLPGFLESRWLLSPHLDARTQISLTDRLLRWVRHHYPDDMYYCAGGIRECTKAIERARVRQRVATKPPTPVSGPSAGTPR